MFSARIAPPTAAIMAVTLSEEHGSQPDWKHAQYCAVATIRQNRIPRQHRKQAGDRQGGGEQKIDLRLGGGEQLPLRKATG